MLALLCHLFAKVREGIGTGDAYPFPGTAALCCIACATTLFWIHRRSLGKTLVSSCVIDRVVASLDRTLWEVPVGFKWFTPGLFDGSCCFGGEESAGASFLKRDGSVWSTDKDGLILGLLAAEISARTGKDPGEHYKELTAKFGTPYYTRIDAPTTPELTQETVTGSGHCYRTRRRGDHGEA